MDQTAAKKIDDIEHKLYLIRSTIEYAKANLDMTDIELIKSRKPVLNAMARIINDIPISRENKIKIISNNVPFQYFTIIACGLYNIVITSYDSRSFRVYDRNQRFVVINCPLTIKSIKYGEYDNKFYLWDYLSTAIYDPITSKFEHLNSSITPFKNYRIHEPICEYGSYLLNIYDEHENLVKSLCGDGNLKKILQVNDSHFMMRFEYRIEIMNDKFELVRYVNFRNENGLCLVNRRLEFLFVQRNKVYMNRKQLKTKMVSRCTLMIEYDNYEPDYIIMGDHLI